MPGEGKVTYKDLFTQVIEEINKRQQFGESDTLNNQLSRDLIAPLDIAANGGLFDVRVSDLIRAVQNLIRDTIPGTIIEGLNVEATSPESDRVIINPGRGSVAGRLYELSEAVEVIIPFDLETEVWFINFHENSIIVESNEHPEKLTVAKIVVPEPGNPFLPVSIRRVFDQRQTGFVTRLDAYIVNLRQLKLFEDGKGKLEEDSVDFLRDNISPILADNLIGNIRLSEDLKIINTAGTAVLDSNSLKFFTPNQTLLLAKFDHRGSFFFNSSGIEVAKFAVDGAHIGNIEINKNSIQDKNFVSGALGRGFQILDNGDAEFNNILVRGKITASVFEKEAISTVGGNLLVLEADLLEVDMGSNDSDNKLVLFGDMTLEFGDIVRIKTGVDDEWMQVIDVVSGEPNTYLVERDKGEQSSANNNPAWPAGVTVSKFGVSGDGGIFMTASESNAPFISVFSHSGTPWDGLDTLVRIGQLNGFLGQTNDRFGIAIGDSENFLKYDVVEGLRIKGNIQITSGNAPIVFQQPEEPGSGFAIKDGDIWVDTDDNNRVYIFRDESGFGFVPLAAEGGITFFKEGGSGVPPPVSNEIGDIWFDTETTKVYRAAIEDADQIAIGEWEQVQPLGMDFEGAVISKVLPGDDIGTPANPGLFMGADFMGFHDGTEFKVFFKNDGTFTFRGDGSNFVSWDGSVLTVRGLLDASDIVTGFLSADRIAANSIAAEKIVTGTLTANEIAAGTITADEIAAGTITADEISAGTITGDKIAANTLTANNIEAGTITGDRIAANTITTNLLTANVITANEIFAKTITADNIKNFTITTPLVVDNAITTAVSGTSSAVLSVTSGSDIILLGAVTHTGGTSGSAFRFARDGVPIGPTYSADPDTTVSMSFTIIGESGGSHTYSFQLFGGGGNRVPEFLTALELKK